MSTMRSLWVLCVIFALQSTALPQGGEPLDLEERVREATLIVVGKLRPVNDVSKYLSGGEVKVEQVLLGATATNKPMAVEYANFPGMFSNTHVFSETNKYICFLTLVPTRMSTNNTLVGVPVGKGRLACNGFELLTDRAFKEVEGLIEKRNKRKGNAPAKGLSQ
jgi:hypothetical protein